MKNLVLGVVLLTALLVRVAVVFVLTGEGFDHYSYDGRVYLAIADAILDGNPVSSFPNGYPLVIALFRLAFGLSHETPLLLLNIGLGVGAVWLTHALTVALTGREWLGVTAAAGMALFPHQLRYTQLLMSETTATFLLALACLLLLLAVRGNPAVATPAANADEPKATAEADSADDPPPPPNDATIPLGLAAGIVLQAASGVRPSLGLVAPVVVLLFLLFRVRRTATLAVVGGCVLGFLFFAGLDVVKVTRPPQTLGNNALISIANDSRTIEFIQYSEEEQKRAPLTYLQFAVKQPARFLTQRAISFWELWGFWSLPGNKPENSTLPVRFVVLCRSILLVLSVCALWMRRRDLQAWVLFAPIFVITLIHVGTFSNHRFVAPLEPMLFALSVAAVAGFWQSRRLKIEEISPG